MKKRTTITTRRREVWIIRQTPKPKHDEDEVADESRSAKSYEHSPQPKPSDKGAEKELKR